MPSKLSPRPGAPSARPPTAGWSSSVLGGRPNGLGALQLPAAEEHGGVQVGGGALVADGELGEPVDLVAPQVDADRHVGGGGEDIDDATAHGHFAPVLNLVLSPVPHRRPSRVSNSSTLSSWPGPDHHRRRVGPAGPSRCSRARTGATMIRGGGGSDGSSGWRHAPQQRQPPAHGLDFGRDPLEGQGVPGRQHRHGALDGTDRGPARRHRAGPPGRSGHRPADRRRPRWPSRQSAASGW